jgi:hypothetical protein
MVDTPILSLVHAAITCLPDPSWISESFSAARRSLLERVICTPQLIPQSSITILVPDV